jgi:glycosyltransferase involved in cell wall biosynthesis
MKKLLIATDCFVPRWDGIVRFLLEIIPGLTSDFEITVVAPRFGDFTPPANCRVVTLPIMKLQFGDINFSGFNYFRIRRLVRESDLVFVQTIGPIGLSAITAGKRCHKPVIAYIHSIEWELATRSINRAKGLVNMVTRWIARRSYNRCSLLIVPSEEVLELYQKNGIRVEKEIVHLGTDTKKFSPPQSKCAAKEHLGIDPNYLVVGYSGRIGREKDLMTLYRAFRRIEKKLPRVKLLVVGKGVKELEDMFTSERNIILPGSVDNVVDYLQAMDVFVLPSLTETSSLATMEAMACGCAVITTKVGFIKEYLHEKYNGMFFPFKNSLVLSLKLELLLENEALRHELGKNARKTIEENFQWSHTIEKIKEILARY